MILRSVLTAIALLALSSAQDCPTLIGKECAPCDAQVRVEVASGQIMCMIIHVWYSKLQGGPPGEVCTKWQDECKKIFCLPLCLRLTWYDRKIWAIHDAFANV